MSTTIDSNPAVNPALPNFRRSAETSALIDFLPSVVEGATVTYDELLERAVLPPSKRPRLFQALSVARKHLEKQGVIFGTITGVGLKRLVPDEIVALGTNTVHRAGRMAKRGIVRMNCADVKRLSAPVRQALNVQMSQLAVIAHAAGQKAKHAITQGVARANASFSASDALELLKQHT